MPFSLNDTDVTGEACPSKACTGFWSFTSQTLTRCAPLVEIAAATIMPSGWTRIGEVAASPGSTELSARTLLASKEMRDQAPDAFNATAYFPVAWASID